MASNLKMSKTSRGVFLVVKIKGTKIPCFLKEKENNFMWFGKDFHI